MNTQKYIYFNSRDTFFRISISQIIMISSDKNYTLMQLTNGQKLVFTFSLQKMQLFLSEELKDDAKSFARIGKSNIINLNYVYQIDIAKQKLHLFDPVTQKSFILDMSKDALKNLRKIFINK